MLPEQQIVASRLLPLWVYWLLVAGAGLWVLLS